MIQITDRNSWRVEVVREGVWNQRTSCQRAVGVSESDENKSRARSGSNGANEALKSSVDPFRKAPMLGGRESWLVTPEETAVGRRDTAAV